MSDVPKKTTADTKEPEGPARAGPSGQGLTTRSGHSPEVDRLETPKVGKKRARRGVTESGTQKLTDSSSDEGTPNSIQTSLAARGSMLKSPGTEEKQSKVAKDLR